MAATPPPDPPDGSDSTPSTPTPAGPPQLTTKPPSSTIQIYARIRPPRLPKNAPPPTHRYWCQQPDAPDTSTAPSAADRPRVGFRVPRELVAGMANHQRETFEFGFDRVFDVEAGQEEVFDVVAKPVVQRCV